MRRIYLIRHGKPDFPLGRRLCLGVTDIPLGEEGRRQGMCLAAFLKEKQMERVYCSDLSRAVQTARCLTDNIRSLPQFREMSTGDWEGLSFEEIKARWPAVYEARGRDSTIPIPGAESYESVQARFLTGLRIALSETRGDIAIVAHATVIQTAICHCLGLPPARSREFPLEYGSVTTIEEENGVLTLRTLGECPIRKEC